MSTSKKSSDGESFEIDEAVALESQTEDDCADHDIPIIPNVDSKILAKHAKMLDLLVHASECRCAHCQYPTCQKMKGLFRHGRQCETRAPGGCLPCKKMWYLLRLHARSCNQESQCHVPRCRDLKEHLRWQKRRCDGQRAAELNNSG